MLSHPKFPSSKITTIKKSKNNYFAYQNSQGSLLETTKNYLKTTCPTKHEKRKSFCNFKCSKIPISTFTKDHDISQLKFSNTANSTKRHNDSKMKVGVASDKSILRQKRNIKSMHNKAFNVSNSNLSNSNISISNNQSTQTAVSTPGDLKYKHMEYKDYYRRLLKNKAKYLQENQLKKKKEIHNISHVELTRQYGSRSYLHSVNGSGRDIISVMNKSALDLKPKTNYLKAPEKKIIGLKKSSSQLNMQLFPNDKSNNNNNKTSLYVKINQNKNYNSNNNNNKTNPSGPEDIHIQFVQLRQNSKMFYQQMGNRIKDQLEHNMNNINCFVSKEKEYEMEKEYPEIEPFIYSNVPIIG